MRKTILLITFLLLFGSQTFAGNVSIPITPTATISTSHDEIEVGDRIKFETTKDIYQNGNLYMAKGTPVYGLVDFVSDNGWGFDNAQIDFKQFKAKTADGKNITIDFPLSINGYDIIKLKSKRVAQIFNYCGVLFRGKEVEILLPQDKIEFEIFEGF